VGTVVEHDQVGVVETAESRAGIGAEEAGEFLAGGWDSGVDDVSVDEGDLTPMSST
jgi:hypothetical protein